MVKCCICGLFFKRITNSHINKRHGVSSLEFSKRYINANRGIVPWNRGETKSTNTSIARLSRRLACQKRWNFSNWQKINKRKSERIKEKKLKRSNELAELIGIILGDGCLTNLPRTEALRIVCNSEQQDYINHIVTLIQKIFDKRPTVYKRSGQKATNITLYRCNLSERLGIPCGNKIKNQVTIPKWIKENRNYSTNCLKGLFETDGSYYEDESNYTCVIEFKNNCRSLLQNVHHILKNFGYHPQFGKNYIRLARRREVFGFKSLINFRNY